MNEDELLQRLAETAREEEEAEGARLDSRWDALAAGLLPKAEEQALRAKAATPAREALEAFSPLGTEFRARTLTKVQQMLHASPATAREPGDGASRADREDGPRAASHAASRRRGLWLRRSAAAAALATAGLLWVLWPAGDFEPLPTYGAELTGGLQEMRGAGETAPPWSAVPQIFASGNTFDLVLRPGREVSGPLELQAFLLHGEELHDWRPPVELVETGSARIVGEVGRQIPLPAGESTIFVAIGRPGSLPSGVELRERLARLYQISAEDWVAWKLGVVLRSP